MVMTLLRWGVVLAVIGWLGSVAVAAGGRYLELNEVIERVVVDARPAGRTADAEPGALLGRIQAQVISRASHADAPLTPDDVLVTASPSALGVTVRWSQPLLTWNGQTLWAAPVSLSRTFSNTP
ncbi:MAG: hypothetical protein HYV93_15465 [Candidatus Rokubacteria bacterium]|nr:hypothetical protein [Candidatus Rokubacteria bacterium]